MRKSTSFVTGVMMFAALQVLAADPPPASTPPAASPPAAGDTDAAKAAAARAKELDQSLRARGYKPAVRNGEAVYCRKETVVGTRFTKTVCGTAEDIERVAVRSQEATEKIQNGLHQIQNN